MRFRTLVAVLISVLVLLGFSGCRSAKLTPAQKAVVSEAKTVYTQVGMWSEKGHIIATNYKRGFHLPVNSRVTIIKVTPRVIRFTYGGQQIDLKNVKRYTKVDISRLMERTFSSTKVDLSRFSESEQKAISRGKITVGMSKDAVIVSRGYPPAHRTPLLDLNSWRYWQNRFNTNIYEFIDGKVSEIIH